LWALPDGAARYAFAVKRSTTTSMTPAQIHELGLEEVARDRAAMLKIAQSLGFKDLASFDASIKTNPALHPKSRQEMLDLYTKYIKAMEPKLPSLFGRLPKAGVQVMQVETYREKSRRRPVHAGHARRQARGSDQGQHRRSRAPHHPRRRDHRVSRGDPRPSHAALDRAGAA